ncbi:MAG: DsbA family protein, partial [Halobacteriaceae archaeon]
MTEILVEHFTDPLSGTCWSLQPTIRRLQYRFDTEWVPRYLIAFPADTSPPLEDWQRQAHRSGMPFNTDDWPNTINSRPACEIAALVRDRHPSSSLQFLREIRERAFVDGSPPINEEQIHSLV